MKNALIAINGNIIVQFKDATFERRIHDSVIFKGEFTLVNSAECGKPNSDIALFTNEIPNATPMLILVESDKLYLNTTLLCG